jgi:hypothetical protein
VTSTDACKSGRMFCDVLGWRTPSQVILRQEGKVCHASSDKVVEISSLHNGPRYVSVRTVETPARSVWLRITIETPVFDVTSLCHWPRVPSIHYGCCAICFTLACSCTSRPRAPHMPTSTSISKSTSPRLIPTTYHSAAAAGHGNSSKTAHQVQYTTSCTSAMLSTRSAFIRFDPLATLQVCNLLDKAMRPRKLLDYIIPRVSKSRLVGFGISRKASVVSLFQESGVSLCFEILSRSFRAPSGGDPHIWLGTSPSPQAVPGCLAPCIRVPWMTPGTHETSLQRFRG